MSMKAYKGFDKNMQCRGFQFAEGETYHEESAGLCKCGFHACEMPLDILAYYAPSDSSIYREVGLDEVAPERNRGDSKCCAKTIKIGAELGIGGLVNAQIEWIRQTIGFDDKTAAAKDGSPNVASGNQGAAQASGDRGAAQASGYQGAAQASGKFSVATAAGWGCRVMGKIGCAIFAVERDQRTAEIMSVAAAIVDGSKIKADTWYECRNGAFEEVI